jgi:hypothetical protein
MRSHALVVKARPPLVVQSMTLIPVGISGH